MARPDLQVEVLGCAPEGDRWRMSVRLANTGATPVRLREAWVPHPRFRGPRETFDPPFALAPGAEQDLAWLVVADRSEGEVENAFLILRVVSGEGEWRVFARITVTFSPDGSPLPRVVQQTVDEG